MENSLYGPYDISNDKEVPLRKATDNQYNNDVRLGAMLNLSFLPADSRHSFDWKNIFNIIAKERYSERVGINTQPDNINNMEYLYSSCTTYTLNSPESTISITIISTGAQVMPTPTATTSACRPPNTAVLSAPLSRKKILIVSENEKCIIWRKVC